MNGAYIAVVLVWYIYYHLAMDKERKIYKNLGINIRKYRLERGISQEKLSEILNANPKFIGHVERVERFVSLKKLIQISSILKVSLSELFNFDEDN